MDTSSVLHQDTFERLKSLLEDDFPMFLGVFLDETKRNVSALGAKNIDPVTCSQLAHSVKSSLATVGALRLSKIASQIEDAPSASEVKSLISSLSEGCDQLFVLLEGS